MPWSMTNFSRAARLCATACAATLLLAGPSANAQRLEPRSLSRTALQTFFAEKTPGAFQGAVLIDHRGKTIFEGAYGYADDRTLRRNRTSTVYDLGSITKQFTATAIMKLAGEGRLKLSDPVEKYFDNVPADKRGVTIAQLMSHTGGFPNVHADDRKVISRPEAVSLIMASKTAPRGTYYYSNSGYTILAVIVEKLTGEPFLPYLRDKFLLPAGLRHTADFSDPMYDRMDVARGYLDGKDMGSPASWNGPTWSTIGNGEFLSTTADLRRWVRAVISGSVLSKEQVKELWTTRVQTRPGRGYGYGWGTAETELGPRVGHSGAGAGGNATFAYYPRHDLLVIIMGNRFEETSPSGSGPTLPADELKDKLEKMLASRLLR